MICMLSQGTTMQASHSASIRPPANPVSPAVMLPASFATFRALRTLGELPLSLIAKATSPGRAKLASCSANMSSYFESFAHAVISGTLSVSAITRNRFFEPFTVPLPRSHAKWEARAALPPFPKRKIVRCRSYACTRISEVRSTCSNGRERIAFESSSKYGRHWEMEFTARGTKRTGRRLPEPGKKNSAE